MFAEITRFQKYILLQNDTSDGDDEWINDAKEKLGKETICENIILSARCNSTRLSELSSLVLKFKSSYESAQERFDFSRLLLKELFETANYCRYETKPAYIAFIYFLTKTYVFKLENVVAKIKKMWETHEEYRHFAWLYFIWFAPELGDDIAPMMKQMVVTERMKINSTPIIQLFFLLMEKKENPNFKWDSLKKERDLTCAEGSILNAIINDDIDSLQILSAQENFDWNMQIVTPMYATNKLMMRHPTIFQVACLYGSIKCVKYLIMNGANPLLVDDMNMNSAIYAVYGGSIEIIRLIEQNGVQFTKMIFEAASYHKHELFNWMMNYEDVSEVTNAKGLTLNYTCIKSNNFIDLMKCSECPIDIQGFTVLHEAAKKGRTSMLKFLIENQKLSSIINNIDAIGFTPIAYAAERGRFHAFKYLLKVDDIDININDHNGKSVFYHAASSSNKCTRELLMMNDGNYDIPDSTGMTPLICATCANAVKTVKMLLVLPYIEINHRDFKSWTALHYAAQRGYRKIARLLIEHPRCDRNAGSLNGRTPLDVSLQFAQMPTVQLLLEYGLVQHV